MTDDDKKRMLGELVHEYGAKKQHLSCVAVKLEQQEATCGSVGLMIERIVKHDMDTRSQTNYERLLSGSEINGLLEEYLSVKAELDHLREQISKINPNVELQ